jgi:hypothetical protein
VTSPSCSTVWQPCSPTINFSRCALLSADTEELIKLMTKCSWVLRTSRQLLRCQEIPCSGFLSWSRNYIFLSQMELSHDSSLKFFSVLSPNILQILRSISPSSSFPTNSIYAFFFFLFVLYDCVHRILPYLFPLKGKGKAIPVTGREGP